jgi:hypothetical protein
MDKLVIEIPIYRREGQSLADAAREMIRRRLGSRRPIEFADSVVAFSDTQRAVLKDRFGRTGTYNHTSGTPPLPSER